MATGASPAAREEIRVWSRSGVERLHLADGTSVVFKYAEGPFADEHLALSVAEDAGLPVPRRLAVVRTPDLLGMLLQDLGPAVREATDEEGAALAVRVHQVGDTDGLPILDGPRLAAMPGRMIDRAGCPPPAGPWAGTASGRRTGSPIRWPSAGPTERRRYGPRPSPAT